MPSVHPVVLCGGSGTRLWPASRRLLPKQFLPLVGERSMLQETVLRAAALPGARAPIIIANAEHRFLVAEQMRAAGIAPAAHILEPVGRNTAPAIAIAALQALQGDAEATLLVLPSDHAIGNGSAFAAAVATAQRLAAERLLVTFGIEPTRPATGYGYIERGEPVAGVAGGFRIRRFVEKPDAATARRYLAAGTFLWNSGMFVLPARVYLAELERHRPDILQASRAAFAEAGRDLDFLRLPEATFAACPAESIDYAVMEKTAAGAVVAAAELGWSDVGAWDALWDIGVKDAAGNVVRGEVHLHGARDSYARADSRLVSLVDVQDLVVVETADAVLVARRGSGEKVKDVVARLEKEGRAEHVAHTRVYRPWGYYETIDAGERFQVKRLMVKPGQAISLQLHRRRAEHWVVVSGTATVTRGDETCDVRENESTFIPLGVRHRLENRGAAPLYLIEVQSGSYLGEDDIERFDDRYGRR